MKYDIVFAWFNVHGGSWHKLIRLREVLGERGIRAAVCVNCDPPLGLQQGLDFTDDHRIALAEQDVFLLPAKEIRAFVLDSKPKLAVFDSHNAGLTGEAVAEARKAGIRTAQLAVLLGDFASHGADHLLIQHPLTLFYDLAYNRTGWRKRLAQAGDFRFTGNIFYEPVPNRWTSDIRNRDDFFGKYGLDPEKPLALWLPDREDGLHESYGQVLEGVRSAGMNVAVKMHPWEYKKHLHGGVDDIYGGKTSAQLWEVPAVDECDGSWAYRYCDLVIIRGTSTAFELARDHKPSVFLPKKDKYEHLCAGFHYLLRECSYMLDDAAKLGAFLRERYPFALTEADFETAVARYMPTKDSFATVCDALLEIMDSAPPKSPVGSLWPFRKAYLGRVPLPLLRKRQIPGHLLAKLFLR